MSTQNIILLSIMVTMTSTGNIMMKIGASVPSTQRILGLMSWTTALGIGIFAGSVLIYAKLLETLPLNLVQAFAALQFVTVICAAFLVLGEPVSLLRWAGIALIVLGILIVGVTAS